MRELGHRDAAVARISPQQAAVDVVGGDGRSAGRSLGVAAPRLAHRVRRHPVHRGHGPRPSPWGAGQERLPARVCLRPAGPPLRRVRLAIVRGRRRPGRRRLRRHLCVRQPGPGAAVRAVATGVGLRSGGSAAPTTVRSGTTGLDAALDPTFARHSAVVVGGSCACGESAIGTCRRADHAEYVRARDRGRRDAGGRRLEGVHRGLASRRASRRRADRVRLVTGRRGEVRIDWVEAARGRCDPRALERLWAGVPEPMRLSRFAESSVPAQFAGAFCHDGTWRAGVDLSPLPEPMRREVAWCVFRMIELGGKIPTPGLSMLVRRLGEVIADGGGRAPASLLALSVPEWCQQIQRVVHRRSGRLAAATTLTNIRRLLTRMMRLLVTASDTGPWWQRDQWNPVEDNRIPLRDHEPMGRYSVRFDRIDTRWLRRGLQWHCKVGLDTGVLSWSTVHRRVVAVGEFDAFLAGRGIDGPWLADHPAGMRALMLDFLGHLRTRPVTRGRRTGQRLSPASVQRLASDVEQFYLFMTDNKDAAAVALAEPGWLRLGPQHAGVYRRGELPGKPRPRLDGQVIDDDAMTQIMGGLDLLGAPVADGGFGDEQAMRITMLVALLGRRVSEICLLRRV